MKRGFHLALLLLAPLLAGGCASEPCLAKVGYTSSAGVKEVDAAVARASEKLGYIPIRHVETETYCGRAVAEGDRRYAKVEPRRRARVIWAHVHASGDGSLLELDVLTRRGIAQTSRLTDEFAAAVGDELGEHGDLLGPNGSTTGLGYSPTWADSRAAER